MTQTLATRKQSRAIRDRMQAIRSELPRDVDAARQRVRQWKDWRYHMQTHPWPILAGAAVLGYLVIPGKPSRPDSETNGAGTKTELSTDPAATKPNIASGIVGAVVTMAVKQGTTLAARQLSQVLFDSRDDS